MVGNCSNLGYMLVEANILTLEQVAQAEAIQKRTGDWLGKVIVELGYITEPSLLEYLKVHLGVDYVEMITMEVAKKVAETIPLSLAERYQVIPIKKSGRQLTLAMVDPTNFYAIDDVRMVSGCEVKPVIATQREIMRAIQQAYSVHAMVEKAVGKLKTDEQDCRKEVYIAEDAPVVNIVNTLISRAVKERASDIHFEPQETALRVRFRIDGFLREVVSFPLNLHAAIISRIKIMSDMDIAEKRIPQDGRIKVREYGRDIDIRVSTLPTITGEKLVMRLLDKKAISLAITELGLSSENFNLYYGLYRQPFGMILVTGPTGAGKTTTLYSTLTTLNTPDKNIVTIEDPVEYQLDGINQIQVNPRIGLTFASGLRSILRQDPNVILVGEIRDAETADIAIRAALTGHLVFSTLHTTDAPGAITRLLDMGIEPYLLASSLLGIVAQRLIRVICPKCKVNFTPDEESAELVFAADKLKPFDVLYRGSGCPHCNQTGYYGRMAIHEVMPIGPSLRDAINQKVSSDTLKNIAVGAGMKTMRLDGIDKARNGITTIHEVMRVSCAQTR